jgi:N-acetyl-alpha-D-glucosaminyl L-malate synthase BshA
VPDQLSIGVIFYPSLGGSGVVATELARGLAERGHDVHVIASSRPMRPIIESDRLHFHEVVIPDYPLFEHPPYGLAVASAIVEVAGRHRLDLIHAHYAVPHAASAYLARQTLGEAAPRVVITLHGTDVTGVGTEPSYKSITRFTVAAADGLTVPSEFLRREAHRLLGLAEEPPIEVIANFVDTNRFTPAVSRDRSRLHRLFAAAAPAPEGPILFHVSNLRRVKRPLDLVEVLARVRRRVPARLVVGGDGPGRAAMQERARVLGVDDSVVVLGARADFAEELKHADVFALPSESESFGVAALEALSCGVPVAGYRVGGLPEVVSEDVGCLVAPYDVDALARAIVEIVTNGERRAALGKAARARALKHFRRTPAIERYESYFRKVLEMGK